MRSTNARDVGTQWRSFQNGLRASAARRRRRRRLVAAGCIALLAGAYGTARVAFRLDGPPPRLEARDAPMPQTEACRAVLRRIAAPAPVLGPAGACEERVSGHRVVYTLDPDLQALATSVLKQYRVPYGALVAIEPATGRVLAMAEYSHEQPASRDLARRATYPAASLIKVITAASALQLGKADPSTVFRFEGSPYVLRPRKLSGDNGRWENNTSTLGEALGRSNNVVFAKVGADLVGSEVLERSLGAFGFNREIPFDFPLQVSRAVVPQERYELGKTSAGFGEVFISPVHAALIASAVANRGVMMQPYVVESLSAPDGTALYRAKPSVLAECTSPEVATELGSMMQNTVARGTSTKVFLRYARRLTKDVSIAGKTGSLMGENPPGMYEWFIGFAPVENPRIAVASLVVNHDLWHIKGSYVAQAVMREFFGL